MQIRDGDWWLVGHDPKIGRTTWMRHNDDGTTTVRTDYAVDPVIDQNRAQRNMAQKGWKGDYHHVASIPLNVYHEQLHAASMQDDQKYVSKWLNDRDNRAWRTKDGEI